MSGYGYSRLANANTLSNPSGYYEYSSEALGLMGGSTHCIRSDGSSGASTLHGLCVPAFMPYSHSSSPAYNVEPTYASECEKWCARNGDSSSSCVNSCKNTYFHPHNRM